MKDIEWENLMRKKALLSIETGSMFRIKGMVSTAYHPDAYNGLILNKPTLMNSAASDLAGACEHFLKATTVYYRLKNSSQLQQSIKHETEINSSLERYLKSPDLMGNLIPEIVPTLNSMSKSDKAGNGHGLYTYYQIQTPLIKTLINHEFISSDTYAPCQQFTYIDLGILTKDFIREGENGQLYLPQDLIEHYRKYRTTYMDARYPITNNNPATQEDIENLNIMSAGLEKILCHCFPELRVGELDFTESRLQSELHSTLNDRFDLPNHPEINEPIQTLDKAGNFYLNNDFTAQEITILLRSLNEIGKNTNLNNLDKDSLKKHYLNLCIYMKHAAVLQQANITFDEKVFKRIEYYTRFVMGSNLFNSNGLRLKNTIFFQLHKKELEKELEKLKEKNTIEQVIKAHVDEIINNRWHKKRYEIGWETMSYPGENRRSIWIAFRDTMFAKLFVELKEDPRYDSLRTYFLSYVATRHENFFHHTPIIAEKADILEFFISMVKNVDIKTLKNQINDHFDRIFNDHVYAIAYTMFIENKNNPEYDNGRNNMIALYPDVDSKVEKIANRLLSIGFSNEEIKNKLLYRKMQTKEAIEKQIKML